MGHPRTPLWLAQPTRFAGYSRNQARWALALLGILLLLSLSSVVTPGPPPATHDPASAGKDRADILLYQEITDRVRGGEDYYRAAAEAQRANGYPVRPFVTMRLPTLAVIQALLPTTATLGLLYTLALAVILAWYRRLRPEFVRRQPALIATTLVGCGSLVFVRPDLAAFHEVWAGMLVALALALWRPDRWLESVAITLCAMLIRETAALFAVAMLASAIVARRRGETVGWVTAIGVFAVVITLHAYAWSLVVRADDPVGPGWTGMLGFGFFIKTITLLTALAALPEILAAPLVALALFGWLAWQAQTGVRSVMVLAAYGLLIALFCRTDTYYWALMVAPFVLVGLAFVPDAIGDLLAAAGNRRRITVTRSIR